MVGCEGRQIRIEMAMDGEGTSRAFASNVLAKDDIDRLRSVYAADPQPDAATGGERFAGTFGERLPSEIGNRNGVSELRTRLGTTRFYFETFAESADEWSALRQRIDAGELWVRLFGRWAERGISDDSKREAWRLFVDRTLVPLSTELAVMWGANAANAQALRVEQSVRREDDRRPMTEEERLLGRTALPMLLVITDAGLLTPEESHRLMLVAADANATKAEREWVVETIGKPALLRLVQRFRPETTTLSSVGWTGLAFGFWMWAQTSPDRNDLLLASRAISDADKEAIRAGKAITLPPPFGIDPLRSPATTDTEVRLATTERPFLTNGEWLEETHEVRFRHGFVASARRQATTPPYYVAAWSQPDAPMQTKLFGSVLLGGAALAEYGVWFEALPRPMQTRWEKALDELEAEGRTDALRRCREECAEEHPLPAPLAAWLDAPRG